MRRPLDKVVEAGRATGVVHLLGKRRITLKDTLQSAYSSAPLREVLEEIFQKTQMGEIKRRVILPATDISNGNVFLIKSPYLDEFVRDRAHHRGRRRHGLRRSAPVLDPVRVKEYLLADGGHLGQQPERGRLHRGRGKAETAARGRAHPVHWHGQRRPALRHRREDTEMGPGRRAGRGGRW